MFESMADKLGVGPDFMSKQEDSPRERARHEYQRMQGEGPGQNEHLSNKDIKNIREDDKIRDKNTFDREEMIKKMREDRAQRMQADMETRGRPGDEAGIPPPPLMTEDTEIEYVTAEDNFFAMAH